ncbi:hypothetical protein GQ600_17426 [Phytophthora cactorum]|nr:hypothetical protein GQ600_17426 [Phytophthora cactorum]
MLRAHVRLTRANTTEAAMKALCNSPDVDNTRCIQDNDGDKANVEATSRTKERDQHQGSSNVSTLAADGAEAPSVEGATPTDADAISNKSGDAVSEVGSASPSLRYESPHVARALSRPSVDSSRSEYSPPRRRNPGDAFAAEDMASDTEEKTDGADDMENDVGESENGEEGRDSGVEDGPRRSLRQTFNDGRSRCTCEEVLENTTAERPSTSMYEL